MGWDGMGWDGMRAHMCAAGAPSSGGSSAVGIGIGIAVGIAALVAVVVLVIWCKRRKSSASLSDFNKESHIGMESTQGKHHIHPSIHPLIHMSQAF